MEQSNALVKALESADTKITRSELIDLIMEEMESELDAEIKAAQSRHDALQKKKWLTARENFKQVTETYTASPIRPDAKLGIGDTYLA